MTIQLRGLKWWLLIIFVLIGFTSQALAERLVWDPSSGEVDGYKVHYGTSSGNFTSSIDVGNVTDYSLDLLSLAENTTYYFTVTAYNSAGDSSYSNIVSFTPGDTTPPLPPVGLQAN